MQLQFPWLKVCRSCGEQKWLSDFHRQAQSADGHNTICKLCACAKTREWAAAHPERVKQAGRAWYERHAEQVKDRARQWAKSHPERRVVIRQASAERHRAEKLAKNKLYAQRMREQNLELTRLKGRQAAHPQWPLPD